MYANFQISSPCGNIFDFVSQRLSRSVGPMHLLHIFCIYMFPLAQNSYPFVDCFFYATYQIIIYYILETMFLSGSLSVCAWIERGKGGHLFYMHSSPITIRVAMILSAKVIYSPLPVTFYASFFTYYICS